LWLSRTEEGWAPQPVKKRCWWSRVRTEGVGGALLAVEAGEEEKRLVGPDGAAADRVVVDIGAKRSAT